MNKQQAEAALAPLIDRAGRLYYDDGFMTVQGEFAMLAEVVVEPSKSPNANLTAVDANSWGVKVSQHSAGY